jgi:hypothetical protein
VALAASSSSSSATAGLGILPDLAGLPVGAAYRLDAEFFNVEDLDGVGESVLGSGNLNHLTLQAELIHRLGDPTASGANASSDELASAADLAARGAAIRPAMTTEPTFNGRLLDAAQEDAPPADGGSSDQRGFGHPTDLATLIGSSQAAGASADPVTSASLDGVGNASDSGAEAAAPPPLRQGDTPGGPQPGGVPVGPGDDPDGTIPDVPDEVPDEVDDLLQTVTDVLTPVLGPDCRQAELHKFHPPSSPKAGAAAPAPLRCLPWLGRAHPDGRQS